MQEPCIARLDFVGPPAPNLNVPPPLPSMTPAPPAKNTLKSLNKKLQVLDQGTLDFLRILGVVLGVLWVVLGLLEVVLEILEVVLEVLEVVLRVLNVLGVPGNIDPASETCGFEISPKALEAQ